MTEQRRRLKQEKSRRERLMEEAQICREAAKALQPGALRDALLRRARETEFAAYIEKWLRSPGLRLPK